MTSFIATLAFLIFTSPPVSSSKTIRISLFSLFKPEALVVRIASGEAAVLDGASAGHRVTRGESVRIRLSGKRLYTRLTGSRDGGEQSAFSPAVRIVPVGTSTLELVIPRRITRTVRGSLTVEPEAAAHGALKIVLTTDREAAVASVVAAETSERAAEALKALAILVRTFMVAQTGRHANEGFDFCDTTHCQLYRGEQDLPDTRGSLAVSEAVADTAHQFLLFEGAPVEGYYTAVCGGLTATPSMVWGGRERYRYQRIACRWCQASRFARWERSARASDVLNALSQATGSTFSDATELTTEIESGGLVRSVALRDRDNRLVLSTDAFRRAIGLRLGWNTVLSPTFSVERRGSRFIFRGRGFGSQIGLCEAGAFAQAASGRTYRQILNFYYPLAETGEVIE